MGFVTVVKKDCGPLVGERVQIADTSLTRMVGLLGKRGLDAGGGLWIKPSSGVHTIGMKFSIDVIGLDRNLKVIKLWRNLVPYRLTTLHWKMQSVIELPAGQIDACHVRVGDVLSISRLD